MREKYMVGGHLLELSTWPEQSAFSKSGPSPPRLLHVRMDSRKLILKSPSGYPPLLRSQGGPGGGDGGGGEGDGGGGEGGGGVGGGGEGGGGGGLGLGGGGLGAGDGDGFSGPGGGGEGEGGGGEGD